MTDQERSEIRKRCKAKYSSEDKVTEKVISMALDLVQFDETKTCDLIDQILKEDQDESQEIQVVTEEEVNYRILEFFKYFTECLVFRVCKTLKMFLSKAKEWMLMFRLPQRSLWQRMCMINSTLKLRNQTKQNNVEIGNLVVCYKHINWKK